MATVNKAIVYGSLQPILRKDTGLGAEMKTERT